MKMQWLSSRKQLGAASASVLAALLFTLSGTASAGIADTKHNLGSGTGLSDRNKVSNTAEICVFCHTPHGADTSAPAPLWNKRLGTNGTSATGSSYTTYASLGTPSLDGATAPVGSISAACLSCHDGTQAMDNIINAPGSGGYDSTGTDGTNTGRGWSWTERAPGGGAILTNGRLTGGIAALGTDLSNDHPIGIEYCGGPASGVTAAANFGSSRANCKDGDFNTLKTSGSGTSTIYWVDTDSNTTRQRTDLPLYKRGASDKGTATEGYPLVECATCHDPHVQEGTQSAAGVAAGATFLRISNAGSAVCLACHVK